MSSPGLSWNLSQLQMSGLFLLSSTSPLLASHKNPLIQLTFTALIIKNRKNMKFAFYF